jgi:hypothetical protein
VYKSQPGIEGKEKLLLKITAIKNPIKIKDIIDKKGTHILIFDFVSRFSSLPFLAFRTSQILTIKIIAKIKFVFYKE